MAEDTKVEGRAEGPSVERLLDALWPAASGAAGDASGEDGKPLWVYAILDGAQDPRIYRRVYDSRLEYECLFTGDLPYELAEAAPYLVRLEREAAFTRWLLEEGWGKSWGIFAWSRADLETMRRHCRQLLRVKDEQGRGLYFRYYDPRVMRVYLPTCTRGEQEEVFGPVGVYWVEGEAGEMWRFRRDGGSEVLRGVEGASRMGRAS